MVRAATRLVGVLSVQLATLVLAHELVFLARWGSRYNEALVHAGHGSGWSDAVRSVAVLAVAVVLVAAARLAWLRARLGVSRSRRGHEDRRLGPRALARSWLRASLVLPPATAALLTVQENLERGAIRGGSFDVAILVSPEYAGGLWITLVVGVMVSLVAALFGWRHRVLQARLGAVRRWRAVAAPAAPSSHARRALDAPIASILGRVSGRRAPPSVIPA